MTFSSQKKALVSVLLGGILLLHLFSSMVFAQAAKAAPAAPSWISVNVTRVKPEMLQDYQDLIKNELNPALQKAGIPWRSTWATAVFGDTYEYVGVTPITNFAQYDQQSPLVRALGQEGATRFGHKIRKCVESGHTYAVIFRPDLSIIGDPAATPKFAVVTNVRVIPGKGADFENWIKSEILPVYKKMNVPGYWVHQTIFGGDANEYTILSLLNNYADLDKGPWLTQAVGAEAAQKILMHGSAFVSGVERSISRVVPELSYTSPVK